jgi:hypothetical protein
LRPPKRRTALRLPIVGRPGRNNRGALSTVNDTTRDTRRLIDGVRGVRYGEIIAVFARDGHFEAEVFGTQFLNDCPQDLWDGLDASAIATGLGALAVKLNGPRRWVIDGIGQKLDILEPVRREFNGLLMRRLALIDLGDSPSTSPYTDKHVHRGVVFFFDAGKAVYELVSPDRRAYVMQAYCLAVDPTTDEASLSTLGDRLGLPDGWTYRVRTLDEELVVDTTHTVATVLQDEFEHTYTLRG